MKIFALYIKSTHTISWDKKLQKIHKLQSEIRGKTAKYQIQKSDNIDKIYSSILSIQIKSNF